MEIWKNIDGYDGDYQVSNLGRVKSLKFGKEKILSPGTSESFFGTVFGYPPVWLY